MPTRTDVINTKSWRLPDGFSVQIAHAEARGTFLDPTYSNLECVAVALLPAAGVDTKLGLIEREQTRTVEHR